MRISDWSSDVCSSDLLAGEQCRQARIGGVVSAFQPEFETEISSGIQNVIGIERIDDNRTTGGPIHTADGHRPLQDLHVRYEAGIDIVAIARAVITAPDRHRLLGPVDDDRHTPRPLHPTNTGIESPAVASIAGEHYDHSFP